MYPNHNKNDNLNNNSHGLHYSIHDNSEEYKNDNIERNEFLKLSENERDSRVKSCWISSIIFLCCTILCSFLLIAYTYKWVKFEEGGSEVGFYLGIAICLILGIAFLVAAVVYNKWNKKQKEVDKQKREKCKSFLQNLYTDITNLSWDMNNKIDENNNKFLQYREKLKQAKKMANMGLVGQGEYRMVEDAFNEFFRKLHANDKEAILLVQEEQLKQIKEMANNGKASNQEVRNIEKTINEIKSHFSESDKEELRQKRVWQTLSSVLDDYNKIVRNENAVLYIQNYVKKRKLHRRYRNIICANKTS